MLVLLVWFNKSFVYYKWKFIYDITTNKKTLVASFKVS
jgi:hypothetical protein